jgi:predicted Rossmann-fold nucleotide-binding protein
MHERKTKMICVTALLLSRGFGTLEEFFWNAYLGSTGLHKNQSQF